MSGYDDAIFLTQDGQVSEASAANIFLVRKGQLITPPVTADILEGITRDAVMELAGKELGMPVIERAVDRTELYAADEVFLSGTGFQIAPVVEVDDRPVGTGEHRARRRAPAGAVLQGRARRVGRVRRLDRRRRGCGAGGGMRYCRPS